MEWIKIEESTPKEGENVLCWNNGERSVTGRYEKGEFYTEGTMDGVHICVSYWTNVTHWQPLPKAPK